MKKKNFTLAILALIVSVSTLVGQTGRSTSMILRYQKVTEFVFDNNIQNYVPKDSVEISGAISVDPVKIFIKGYNQTQDKTLTIVEVQKEKSTNRDMYICEMNGERYAVAISPDKKYLTQIGVSDKFIYELQANNQQQEQYEVIPLKIHAKSNIIYLAQTLEQKPLFGKAKSFAESELLLKEYLSEELKKYDGLQSGTSFIYIEINSTGKVENVKLLYGKDKDFNAAALRIVKSIPNWLPGQKDGIPVNVSYNLEVKK